MAELEWVSIKNLGPEPIGAIGFIGNNVVAVIAFYDDKDANQDGKVSLGERVISSLSPISVEGRNVTEVAMTARVDRDITRRDASIDQMAKQMHLQFFSGLVMEGFYTVYFARGVKMTGKGVAKLITNNMVKELVIRKGFEAAVKKAFLNATGTSGV